MPSARIAQIFLRSCCDAASRRHNGSAKMNEELRITFEPDNEPAKVFVTNNLDNYNIAVTGCSAYYPVAYFLKSDEGEVRGGLLGMIWGGWLHIKYVWVAEQVRGKGHARR